MDALPSNVNLIRPSPALVVPGLPISVFLPSTPRRYQRASAPVGTPQRSLTVLPNIKLIRDSRENWLEEEEDDEDMDMLE